MNQGSKRSLRWLLILLTQLALASCAAGQPMYFHSFSFNALSDAKVYGQPEIDILDYSYGGSRQFGMHADPEIVASGQPINQHGITGMMPRGEYLYVKWRIKATGEVLEDRVDLSKRLPADITNYEIHFAVYGKQLYIYAFPPYKTTDFLGRVTVNGGAVPEGKVLTRLPNGKAGIREVLPDIPYAREHQIYPDLKK